MTQPSSAPSDNKEQSDDHEAGATVASQGSPGSTATIEYCGESFPIAEGERVSIGREADIVIDENLFLHRRFLMVESVDGYWVLRNIGNQLGATVSESKRRFEAFLAPGASLPLVFDHTIVTFTAGSTTYEMEIHIAEQPYSMPVIDGESSGETTIGPVRLTFDQRLLIVALAEPRLRLDGSMAINLPSSPEAARRLGWSSSKFNRKLDNVCEKLAKRGVRGLQGDIASYAANRKSRLVEYAVATRLVTDQDLAVLDDYLAELEAGSVEDGEQG